jgi:ubiquinone/menaquinone biosynthesis C-methylase UbiE
MKGKTITELNQQQAISEHDAFTPARYRDFLQYLHRGTRELLDIGCNTGRGGVALKTKTPQLVITGLDCVEERIQKLDRSVYGSGICGFSHELPFRNNSFDAVLAGEVIEHIPPLLVFPSLCEVFRVLRLRGQILLTTPNPHYLRNRIRGLSVLLDPSHLSQHTSGSLRRRLEDVGFSNIRMYGTGRLSAIVGRRLPVRSIYGSYLTVAEKW